MALRTYVIGSLRVAAVMGLSDTIAQLYFEKQDEWDAGRTLGYSALGLVVVGPSVHSWYFFLERAVPKELPIVQRGLRKMLLDQIVFAPPYSLVMSCLVPLLNGDTMEQIKWRLRNTYFHILAINLMVWPLAQLINFTFVPLAYQVLFVQGISLIWNCNMSVILNKKPQ